MNLFILTTGFWILTSDFRIAKEKMLLEQLYEIKKIYLPMFLAVIFFIVGCATVMTQEAARIKISSSEEVKGFEYLGMVEGSSTLSGVARES